MFLPQLSINVKYKYGKHCIIWLNACKIKCLLIISSLTGTAHNGPENPEAQSHELLSTHVPPFRQTGSQTAVHKKTYLKLF